MFARLVARLVALGALAGCAPAISSAATGLPTTSPAPAPTSATETTSAPTSSTAGGHGEPVVLGAASVGADASPLVRAVDATWSRTTGGSCLLVADGEHVVYERNPDLAVLPASTMKLLTATAVLTRIDPESRLHTPVLAAAPPDADGVVHGDLWLVGGGDPLLSTHDYTAHFQRQPRLASPMEALADGIAAAGVRHVTGRILGDDGRHDRQRYLPSWPRRYITDHETGPLSALSVNDGFLGWSPDVPFADPAAGAAGVLNELLRQRGLQIDGSPGSGGVPAGAVEVASLPSPTIGELVEEMLRESDNTTAELLLRELGLQVLGTGTSDAGARVVDDTLRRLGLPMTGVRVVDGSGLDPANRVTCRLLYAILTQPPTRLIVGAGLPVAAQTGTLYKRFLATPVAGHLRAKTGSIRRVAALTGYADNLAGPTLTFAYLQSGVSARQGTMRQDELGHDLVLSAP
jgi:D-alanyl-D-alanine carboxypeptidase/D-alanyl-D-alanine-endopeptidase (penicillin-binding protein 4)